MISPYSMSKSISYSFHFCHTCSCLCGGVHCCLFRFLAMSKELRLQWLDMNRIGKSLEVALRNACIHRCLQETEGHNNGMISQIRKTINSPYISGFFYCISEHFVSVTHIFQYLKKSRKPELCESFLI